MSQNQNRIEIRPVELRENGRRQEGRLADDGIFADTLGQSVAEVVRL